ncbi:hypothetical protein BJ170DRAFT_637991 [Xylariales sp. AK1849]|nr:hypothetical protein BJ170DRAFT_637991 [Xylariales sp. AK1849]
MLTKFFTLSAALGLAAAQNTYLNQSAPFNLVLSSTTNETLNGLKLGACHSGAGIESLCLYDGTDLSFSSFYFNTSGPADPTTEQQGLLNWYLVGGNFVENEAVSFEYNTASNLAFPLLYPSADDAQPLAFTEDLLAVPAYVDDSYGSPGPYRSSPTFWNNRWAICRTYYAGYTYTALQWVLGSSTPQNPSCDYVTVKRVYIS